MGSMDKLWSYMEGMLHFIIFRILGLKINKEMWKKLCQFIKFGIVGLSNTLISYVVYAVLINLRWHYLLASVGGFLVSIVNAYYWNNRYVFKMERGEERVWWRVFLKMFVSYAGTGLVLNNMLLILWVDGLGFHKMLGPVINLFVTIPLNFFLNKYWAYKDKV